MDDDEAIDVPEELTIDLHGITSSRQLHELLLRNLQFPPWYGHNWAAFWDAIRGLVPLPKRLTFLGWNHLVEMLPHDADKLRTILERYEAECGHIPGDRCEVIYRE